MKKSKVIAILTVGILSVSGLTGIAVAHAHASQDKIVKVYGASCNHSGCQCDGYIGYQTAGGYYKGRCMNSDGWGHHCNHSPQEHGLR